MDKSRWEIINEIFDTAVELSGEEREKYLNETCGHDPELLTRVTSLLNADTAESSGPLDELTIDLPKLLGATSLRGSRIGSYEVLRELGSGGMGIVYLARDHKLNRDVALKFLPPMLAMDEAIRARFTREARAAASLNHPNIVTVYEVSSHGPIPFIAMEYIEGVTLQTRLEAGRIGMEEFNRLAGQLIHGIAEAHSAGIIHRDIKPGNLMIDKSGRLRILDFGLAKSIDDHAHTRTGSTMGTVEYLSPEQVKGEELDCRSDLFSIGSAFYEMTTGVTPFNKRNSVAVIQSICNDTPKSIRSQNHDVPPTLERIILRLLEKEPGKRYQSATEVIADLEKYARGETVPRRPGHFAEFLRLRIIAPLLAVVATGLLISWYYGFPGGTPGGRVSKVAFFPLLNLGPQEDAYFVDGYSNDLRSRLSGVTGVEIFGAETEFTGAGLHASGASLDELGVDYLFSGSMEWIKSTEPDTVTLSYTLVNAHTSDTVLNETLTKPARDAFALQDAVAGKLARTLVETEDMALVTAGRKPPTDNIEAYDFYLRGLNYYKKGNSWENRLLALEMYRRAIELDSNFALPYARIGELYSLMYYANYDHTENRLRLAKSAIDKSLGIDSSSAEGHTALGLYYYWGFRDYERAEEEFRVSLRALPDQPEVHNNVALVLRRKGNWAGAVEHLQEAIRLNPLSHQYLSNLAGTLTFMRKYRMADSLWDRVIWLSPEWAWPYSKKARNQILWRGDVDSAIAIVKAGRKHARYATLDLQYVRLLAMAGHVKEAKKQLTLAAVLLNETDEPRDTAQFFIASAELALAEEDSLGADSLLDSANAYLDRQEMRSSTSGYRHLLRKSEFLALRGQPDSARILFERTLTYPDVMKDSLARAGLALAGAELFARLNLTRPALEYLREALSTNSLISSTWALSDPLWSKMLSQPELLELLQEHEGDADR